MARNRDNAREDELGDIFTGLSRPREELEAHFIKFVLPAARGVIVMSTQAGQLRDIPPDRILRSFVSLVFGYIVTRYVLLTDDTFVFLHGVATRDS